jgi:hypothetical protein
MARHFKKNRKRKKRSIGNLLSIKTICVVLVAALAVLGASHAAWSQSFHIFGSINSGDVNVLLRDVIFESSDTYESLSLEKDTQGGIVEQVNMDIVTDANPFSMTLIFIVENNGTIPVVCEGIDSSVPDNLEVRLVDSPGRIDTGQTASIKVEISKGYCQNFEFSIFLRFVQATG